jgi:hypothetical protein
MEDSSAMSDARTEKPTKRGGGTAFHSRLEPFVDFIRQQRQQRKTWKEIAHLLCAQKGCPITLQGVHQFYRRYLERLTQPHWERDACAEPLETPLTKQSRNTALASTPPQRSFKAVDPARINLNDLTKL